MNQGQNNEAEDFIAVTSPPTNFKGYLIFWVGQLISLLGSNIVGFAVIWWIVLETGSEVFLGLAAFLNFAPFIILTPFAGVLVDRWSRKKIIATVDFLQAVMTLILIYFFWVNLATIWHVLAINTVRACFQAIHTPATEAIVPLMVPRDKLTRINALTYLLYGMITLISPVIAALLLEYWKIGEILWIDAITFVIAVVPLLFLKIPSVRPKEKETKEEEQTSFKEEFIEGVTFIRDKEGLLSLLSVFTSVNFFHMPLYILLPLWVKSVNNGGAGELALLLACNSLGNLLGSILMSTILSKGFKKKVHGVVGGLTLGYVGFFFVGFAPEGAFWFMAIGMFILGVDLPIANISSQTIWQTVVPPEKIGRVFSVRQTIAQISAPAGMILSGIIAEAIGIRIVYLAAASIGFLLLGYLWFFTGLSNVEKTLGIDFAEPTPIIDKEVIAATSSEEIKEEKKVPDVRSSES